MTDDFSHCRGFQWDEGNTEKNWVQHQVSHGEAEQVFFNRPLVVVEGEQRAEFRRRYYALGHTDANRLLFLVFASVMISSRNFARPMSRRRSAYGMQEDAVGIDSTVWRTQEQEFWSSHDSTAYVDWSKAQHVTFGRLKPSTQTISIRLPAALLEDLKLLANKRDVPYQSLVKIFLAERVAQEQRSRT